MVKQRDQGQNLILDVDTILVQRFISLTKCPGIWPVFLHLALCGFMSLLSDSVLHSKCILSSVFPDLPGYQPCHRRK